MQASTPITLHPHEQKAAAAGRLGLVVRAMEPQPIIEPEMDEALFEGPYWFNPTVIDDEGYAQPGEPVYGISCPDGEWGVYAPCAPGDVLTFDEGSMRVVAVEALRLQEMSDDQAFNAGFGVPEIKHGWAKITPRIHDPEALRAWWDAADPHLPYNDNPWAWGIRLEMME